MVTATALLAGGCGADIDTAALAPESYSDRLYKETVRQRLDFTCGGAALATILTHYWGRPTTEEEVLGLLRARYPDAAAWQSKIKDGFSFDDISFAALVLGYESSAARVSIDQLAALNGPVIVHLDKGTFQHFSVLRRTDGTTYYFADPILGRRGMPRHEMERQYTGSALAIWKQDMPLPKNAPLALVRDGLSVGRTLEAVSAPIQTPIIPPL